MARQEEIQKLIDEEMGIDNYGSCDFQVGVIYGVKYADKTTIEKILQWLKSHIKPEQNHRGFKSDYCIVELYNGETYPIHGSFEEWEKQYNDLRETNKSLSSKMSNDFRKALEE